METIKCSNCGSSEGEWDSRKLTFHCFRCRRESHFLRKDINSDVGYRSEKAVQGFCDKNYDVAEKLAMEIVGISYYHAPANYILAYIGEIINHKYNKLDEFFTEMESQEEIEDSEIEELEKMIISSPSRLIDYEPRIINLIAKHIAKDKSYEQMKSNLLRFTDTICPYWISTRTSSDFLTKELADIYKEMAQHCSIPKTCYALYNAIVKIPDSPCVNNTFYLTTKTRKFYENFILPIGEIINSIQDNDTKAKFSAAYENRKKQFEAKMQ